MDHIHRIVDSTPVISKIRKEYLKKAMNIRYEQILLPALIMVLQSEKDKAPVQDMNLKSTPKTKPTRMERLEEGTHKVKEQ